MRNKEYFWLGGSLKGHAQIPGSDCEAIDQKKISINPLKLLEDSSDEIAKWSGIVE